MIKFKVMTEKPFATKSKDFIVPGGAMMDFSFNTDFNEACLDLFPYRPSVALLDLGCSNGTAVETFLKNDKKRSIVRSGAKVQEVEYIAAGVDGCDYQVQRESGSWSRIPDNLLCADLCWHFTVYNAKLQEKTNGYVTPFRFEIITAWEVMEHLPEDKLDIFFNNVNAHLMPDGVFAMSISFQPGYHHETVKDLQWWLDLFDKKGFATCPLAMDKFANCWIRGMKEPNSFNLAVRRKIWRPGTNSNEGI